MTHSAPRSALRERVSSRRGVVWSVEEFLAPSGSLLSLLPCHRLFLANLVLGLRVILAGLFDLLLHPFLRRSLREGHLSLHSLIGGLVCGLLPSGLLPGLILGILRGLRFGLGARGSPFGGFCLMEALLLGDRVFQHDVRVVLSAEARVVKAISVARLVVGHQPCQSVLELQAALLFFSISAVAGADVFHVLCYVGLVS